MESNMKLNLLIAAVSLMSVMGLSGAQAKSRTPALTHAMWQTQDEWYVDSGLYIDGQVPSYNQRPSQNLYLTVAGTRHQDRLTEGRAAFVPQGYFISGREQMVMALGA
jgi:hypothetical protein